jgi:hypothetical protein
LHIVFFLNWVHVQKDVKFLKMGRALKFVRTLNPIMLFLTLKNAILALKTSSIENNVSDIHIVSVVRPDITLDALRDA